MRKTGRFSHLPAILLSQAEADALPAFFEMLATASAKAILPLYRTALRVDNKIAEGFDPVTEADRTCELALRQLIEDAHPDAGILGEEFGATRADARDLWVLDPIDGTRAFIAGIPVWGVLAGLRREGRAVAGLMHQPFNGESFVGLHGENGSEAFYTRGPERRTLCTRPCSGLGTAYAMTTAPELLDKRTTSLLGEARHLRFGADCYAYCMLAMGQIDLVIERGLQPYDIMALIPIVEAAGGVVTDFAGGRPESGGDLVATGDPGLHDAVLARLNR